jgi:HK97 family phage prohead protease
VSEAVPRPALEFRAATVSGVNFDQRIITLLAVPYDEEATIEYRGETWLETFLRGAFDGVEKSTRQVRANRDHDKGKTVGKALNFWPSREEGLVADIRIAPTVLGDETLTLADEDMLSPSVGFGVRGSDQILERPYRKIKRAFLDHVSFVETPAYPGAKVLAVREGEDVLAADLPKLVTPRLDEVQAWLRTRQVS